MTKQQTRKFMLVPHTFSTKVEKEMLLTDCHTFLLMSENMVAHYLNDDHILLFPWPCLHDSLFDIIQRKNVHF